MIHSGERRYAEPLTPANKHYGLLHFDSEMRRTFQPFPMLKDSTIYRTAPGRSHVSTVSEAS